MSSYTVFYKWDCETYIFNKLETKLSLLVPSAIYRDVLSTV